MFAQSLVEYGALSAMIAGLEHAASSAYEWVEGLGSTAWIVIGAVVLAALFVRRTRASRM